MKRRNVLLTTTAVLAGLAGCTSEGSSPQTTNETPTTTTTPKTTEASPTETADPTVAPSVLSDGEAKERALNAEEQYLRDYLSDATCLNNWGTYPTTADKEATVTSRTETGVLVDVKHPYSFSTDSSEADGASEAVYVVTPETVERKRGEDIEDGVPC